MKKTLNITASCSDRVAGKEVWVTYVTHPKPQWHFRIQKVPVLKIDIPVDLHISAIQHWLKRLNIKSFVTESQRTEIYRYFISAIYTIKADIKGHVNI